MVSELQFSELIQFIEISVKVIELLDHFQAYRRQAPLPPAASLSISFHNHGVDMFGGKEIFSNPFEFFQSYAYMVANVEVSAIPATKQLRWCDRGKLVKNGIYCCWRKSLFWMGQLDVLGLRNESPSRTCRSRISAHLPCHCGSSRE